MCFKFCVLLPLCGVLLLLNAFWSGVLVGVHYQQSFLEGFQVADLSPALSLLSSLVALECLLLWCRSAFSCDVNVVVFSWDVFCCDANCGIDFPVISLA